MKKKKTDFIYSWFYLIFFLENATDALEKESTLQRHRSAPPFNAPYLKETKKKNEVQPNKESKKRKREKEKEKERKRKQQKADKEKRSEEA